MALLFEDLTYKIRGLCFEIRKQYGGGQKEVIYQRALEEKLLFANIPHTREAKIKIKSRDTGMTLGYYQPDFLVDDSVILELKAVPWLKKPMKQQLYDYLRNSVYEVGLLINFSLDGCKVERMIHTRDRKWKGTDHTEENGQNGKSRG
tara:strand:- start:294 stop:737 length:444 start_codon:yes stop_codon:yes gene_type:complete